MPEQPAGNQPPPQPVSPTLDYAAPAPANPPATASMALGWVSLACIALSCAGMGYWRPGIWLSGPLWPLTAILATVFGFIGLRRARSIAGTGQTRARVGLILGLVNLTLCLLFAIAVPMLGAPRPRAQRIGCASNLRQIGQGIWLYANLHQGRYPPRLELLITENGLDPYVFVCPSTGADPAAGPTTQAVLADFAKPGRCSYIYLGANLNPSSPHNAIAAYEIIDHHEHAGANFLFNDGHVEWLAKDRAQKMIANLQAGHNPPSTRPGM